MRLEKGQSAIEFIMTYSYAFLIIAVAISVLIIFISIPRTTIPFQCNGYGGLTCTDVALVTAGNSALAINANGESLIILLLDNQPGVINVLTFNAFLGYQTSTPGFCTPTRLISGQYMYCMANFSFASVQTNIYTGTYNVSANYCVTSAQNLSSVACAATTNFLYTGSIRVQPQAQNTLTYTLSALVNNAPFTQNYAPITITNNQPVATPSPFQVLIQFPSNTYTSYIRSQWSNVEFSTAPGGRGTLLEAWIESGASNTLSNTMIWVDLPSGIPANSSVKIYADFLPVNVLSQYGPTGEAPSLSTNY